ncbi:hypothetical protein H4582DRAFT_2057614 [Lactarius indigo]|nr:hypothetical protein H4582DRAFT_2057614 [Lactarius indigo]
MRVIIGAIHGHTSLSNEYASAIPFNAQDLRRTWVLLERVQMYNMQEARAVLEIVREQCWLNEILNGIAWMPEVVPGPPVGDILRRSCRAHLPRAPVHARNGQYLRAIERTGSNSRGVGRDGRRCSEANAGGSGPAWRRAWIAREGEKTATGNAYRKCGDVVLGCTFQYEHPSSDASAGSFRNGMRFLQWQVRIGGQQRTQDVQSPHVAQTTSRRPWSHCSGAGSSWRNRSPLCAGGAAYLKAYLLFGIRSSALA